MSVKTFVRRKTPIQMKHQIRAGLLFTGLLCGLLCLFNSLVERKDERVVGGDMYVMF